MPKSIVRKSKIVMESTADEKNTITFTINIESNHVNNQLDTLQQTIENVTNSLIGYKIKEDKKPEKEDKPKVNKKYAKSFGAGGAFV